MTKRPCERERASPAWESCARWNDAAGAARPRRLCDLPCRQSLRPGLHEHSEDPQTRFLGERAERLDRVYRFHNSNNIETTANVKPQFSSPTQVTPARRRPR